MGGHSLFLSVILHPSIRQITTKSHLFNGELYNNKHIITIEKEIRNSIPTIPSKEVSGTIPDRCK